MSPREKEQRKDIHRHGIVFHTGRVKLFFHRSEVFLLSEGALLDSERALQNMAEEMTRKITGKGLGMIKERFQELSNQLCALRKRSTETRNSEELRSLVKEMRGILKEIDDLVERQTQWSRYPTTERNS